MGKLLSLFGVYKFALIGVTVLMVTSNLYSFRKGAEIAENAYAAEKLEMIAKAQKQENDHAATLGKVKKKLAQIIREVQPAIKYIDKKVIEYVETTVDGPCLPDSFMHEINSYPNIQLRGNTRSPFKAANTASRLQVRGETRLSSRSQREYENIISELT